MKVQIVEDNIYSADSIKIIIEDLGHEVTDICVDMSSAIESFNKNLPELIIMDIELQDRPKGGIELTKIFNKIDNSIPIIYCSDKLKDNSIMREAAQTKSVAILNKIFDKTQLEANIEKAIFEKQRFLDDKEVNNQLGNKILRIQEDIRARLEDIITLIKYPFKIFKPREYFTISEYLHSEKHTVRFEDVCYIQAFGKSDTIRIVTDSKAIVHSNSLSKFQKKYNHPSWQKIHRSHLVNVDKITEISTSEALVIISIGNKKEKLEYSASFFEDLKKKVHFSKTNSGQISFS